MKRVLTAILLVLCIAAWTGAQDRRAYTFDDHISMKRLGGPNLSPDGKWIAYTMTAYDKAKNSGSTSIYIISSEGGEPQEFAKGSQPTWSPDGKHMAFVRDGQIWLIDLRGGEAQKITSIPTGADGPTWSNDSSKLLFTSMVWPGATEEENAAKLQAMEESKVKAIPTEDLLFRHWNTWRLDGRINHLFILDIASGDYKDLTPDATFDVPPFPFGGVGDYAFSPDDAEVAFVAKASENPAWNTNLDIFTVPAAGGELTNITAANEAQDSGPVAYSPDGKYLAYGAMQRPGFEADRIQLTLYDRSSGEHRSITSNFDRSAGGWLWKPDSSGLFFTAADKAAEPIFSVSATGNDVAAVLSGHTNRGLQLSSDGGTLYYAKQSLSHPVDLYKVAADGSGETQLTSANKALLEQIEMSRVEEEYYEGANGDQIQMFILYPPGFDPNKKWPVVVLIHGGPQGNFGDDFHYRWNAQLFAAPGYIVITPNFHGSTSFGQDFTDSITKNWGGLPYTDIMKSVEYLEEKPFVDPGRFGAAGGSYGGYMIDWIATQTDRFSALISHAGIYNAVSMYGATEELWFTDWEFNGPFWQDMTYYKKWSPHFYAANLGKYKTPTFVIHGQNDFRVPVTQGFELYTALKRQGVPTRLLYYPDETHFVLKPQNAELWYNEVHAWFKRWIGVGPSE